MRSMKFVFFFFVLTLFSCSRTGHRPPIKYKDNEYRVISGGYSSISGLILIMYMKDSRLNPSGSTALGIIDCLISEHIEYIAKYHSKACFSIVDKNFNTEYDINRKMRLKICIKIVENEYTITSLWTVEKNIKISDFEPRKIGCDS